VIVLEKQRLRHESPDDLLVGWGLQTREDRGQPLGLTSSGLGYDETVGMLDEPALAGPNELELRQQSIANSAGRFTVADAVFSHIAHDNRHLRQIECLRGLLGLAGSATQ
jgi:hypothetical protein